MATQKRLQLSLPAAKIIFAPADMNSAKEVAGFYRCMASIAAPGVVLKTADAETVEAAIDDLEKRNEAAGKLRFPHLVIKAANFREASVHEYAHESLPFSVAICGPTDGDAEDELLETLSDHDNFCTLQVRKAGETMLEFAKRILATK